MTNWAGARKRRSFADLSPHAQCDLVWAWLWCRPLKLRDWVFFHEWLMLGMEDGIPAFLSREEPVWTVHLLELCYPRAALADLQHAAALFFGIRPGELDKQRTLRKGGANSTGWVNETEAAIKRTWHMLEEGDPDVGSPWSDLELAEMQNPGSIHRLGTVELGKILCVTRWFIDNGAFLGGDTVTGKTHAAWSIALGKAQGKAQGYLRPAYPKGPDFTGMDRSGVVLDQDGWSPPPMPPGFQAV